MLGSITVSITALCMTLYFSCECAALKSANDEYSSKLRSGCAKETTLLDLAWKVDDLSRLSSSGRLLLTEVVSIKELLEKPNPDITGSNVARRLNNLQERLVELVKGECSVHTNPCCVRVRHKFILFCIYVSSDVLRTTEVVILLHFQHIHILTQPQDCTSISVQLQHTY